VTLALIEQAVAQGATLEAAAARLGLSARTVQRWRQPESEEDGRVGPHTAPANRLSDAERRHVLALANSPEFRDVSPKQMVPRLADRGEYVASEATVYRVLKAEGQLAHRGKAKPPVKRATPDLLATGRNTVWTWDITYLRGPVRGTFLYLYLVVDVYSRRIMGWDVHEDESMELAAQLINRCFAEAGQPEGLTLHSDNGGPMKGSTMLATLRALGIAASFSRPKVSDDNPFSEALFRTLKYRPAYPDAPFAGLDDAKTWVARFVAWYNTQHRHSGIRFVTPEQRYQGLDVAILLERQKVYRRAQKQQPERWSGATRNWEPIGPVRLGPSPKATLELLPNRAQAA
jgi:putative transposase